MMEDYLKAEKELQEEKDKLNARLIKVLEKNNTKLYSAWFNWQTKVLVWGNCYIPRQVILDLEDEFGAIRCIYTTKMSDYLYIKFKRGE